MTPKGLRTSCAAAAESSLQGRQALAVNKLLLGGAS